MSGNKGEAITAAVNEMRAQETLRRIAEQSKKGSFIKHRNRAVDIYEKERMRAIGKNN